jgi:hypothetical protein
MVSTTALPGVDERAGPGGARGELEDMTSLSRRTPAVASAAHRSVGRDNYGRQAALADVASR